MSSSFDIQYRNEWRSLGFYYEFNAHKRCWIFIGSKGGLLNFSELLFAYAIDKSKKEISEHAHYGPDSYLKVITWNAPMIMESGIYGSLADIKRLGDIFRKILMSNKDKTQLKIDKEYSKNNDCYILLKIKQDNFDPAIYYKPN